MHELKWVIKPSAAERMNSIIAPIRRRFSSNASTVVMEEPDSPGADDMRPTISEPTNLRTSSMMSPILAAPADLPTPPVSLHSAAPSAATEYFPAQEEIEHTSQDIEQYRPFPTMEEICQEEGIGYPLERQTNRRAVVPYIHNVGGFDGPVLYSPGTFTTVTELRENRVAGVKRRVSLVGRQARKLSGELARRASRLVKMRNVPDVIRNKQRDGFDLEADWLPRVSLGREIEDESPLWPQSIEQDFRMVQWQAEVGVAL